MTKKLWLTKEARGSQYTETRRYISGFELIINTIVLCSQERCPSQRGFCYYGGTTTKLRFGTVYLWHWLPTGKAYFQREISFLQYKSVCCDFYPSRKWQNWPWKRKLQTATCPVEDTGREFLNEWRKQEYTPDEARILNESSWFHSLAVRGMHTSDSCVWHLSTKQYTDQWCIVYFHFIHVSLTNQKIPCARQGTALAHLIRRASCLNGV